MLQDEYEEGSMRALNAAPVSGKETDQISSKFVIGIIIPTIVLFTLLHSTFRSLPINGHGIKK